MKIHPRQHVTFWHFPRYSYCMQLKQAFTNYTALSDDALIERSRNDDSDAFAELYSRYLTRVYRFIFRRAGGDVALAEDLTSQTFLEALDNLPKYRERGCFAAWLFTILQLDIVSDSWGLTDLRPSTPTPNLYYTQLCRDEYPKGNIKVQLWQLAVLLENTWQATWQP